LGIHGRTVVAEMLWLDEQSRQFICENQPTQWIRYLKQKGWQSYQDQLLHLVAQGKVDPLDAEALVGELIDIS
jgi:type II secretory ATPase GspE/PulE/Tfp pilus assembly ATPase PilB-like protein